MSSSLRNKQGCWTCRVRRKKCDGAHPKCSTCESLSITCYGYGPKPDWVDHGEKEKSIVNELKQTVRHTSRRKIAGKILKNPAHLMKIAPKSSNESSSSSSSPRSNLHPQSSDHASSPDDGANSLPDRPSSYPQPHDQNDDLVLYPISPDESMSLMHYLDNVFRLQYPMYKPNTPMGGRGWLLALLLRTKPLYHASLAFSSYHRRKITLTTLRDHPCWVAILVEQEKHLAICLNEFQQLLKSINKSIQTPCPSQALGVLALVVQLSFFELITGQGSEWKIHLRAATNLCRREFREGLINLGLSDRSKDILAGSHFTVQDGASVIEQITIFTFFAGTTIWLDIISAITMGTSPQLLAHHSQYISSASFPIKLEDVMGCRNWVMLQIGRIAAFHERKIQALKEEDLASLKFEETVGDITRELQAGLAHTALEGLNFSDGVNDDISVPSTIPLNSDTLVTHMFGNMATIYLHLVAYGFQNLDSLNTTICATMGLLHTQIPNNLLPALVCPLYVIGSVARHEEEKTFFRHIFSSAPVLDPLFEHRSKILPALEEIWRRRQTKTDFTWDQTLDLVDNILLL